MKRILSMVLPAVLVTTLLCGTVSAASEQRALKAGFYDIDTVDDVSIELCTADNVKVNATSAAVGQEISEYYEGAERIKVTYTGDADEGDRFMALLVTGDGLPTVSDAICYINQVAMADGTVVFDVYPLLPTVCTDMTLYITGSREDFATIQVGLKYAVDDTYTEASGTPPAEEEYVLGDVNDDGEIDTLDSLIALRIYVNSYTPTSTERLAADVTRDGTVDTLDSLQILRYYVKNITSF